MSDLAARLRSIGPVIQQNAEEWEPIDFGEWQPDLPDIANPGATQCFNVIPEANSYAPARSLVNVSTNTLDERALGVIASRDSANNVFTYAGDKSKLYLLADNAFVDVSKVGLYNTLDDDIWEFSVWNRNDQVIATNFNDPIQVRQIGAGTGTKFADLITSTNKPKAKHIAVVRNFVTLGNTSDATDGHVPNRVWWSAIRDATNFDPNATTQCDFADLPDGGWVQRVVGGAEYGVVFQEKLIRRMTYVGSPVVFDLEPVDRQRGTPVPNSVVGYGRYVFYVAEDGFYAFNGSSSEPIGNNRVDRTFWRQFDLANKDLVSTSIDRRNKLVCWAFPSLGGTNGLPNKLFVYRWAPPQRWSEIEVDVEMIADAQSQGFTLDGLDAVSTNIDTLTPSLDSDVWKGGKIYSGAFDHQHRLQSFDGPTLEAVIDTGERQLTAGGATRIKSVRPMVTFDTTQEQPLAPPVGLGIQASIVHRDRLDVPLSTTPLVALNDIGEADIENRARYQRMRVHITAGQPWEHAVGVAVFKTKAGRLG